MGNSEEPKSDKAPSSPVDQTNLHVYPDWAATMQAYYGPRVPMPHFFGANVGSGQASHPYMWGHPQHMMPSYGPPYAAIYSHGGVYANPGAVPPPGPALNSENATKASGITEHSLRKNSKGFDGLVMSTGDGRGANHSDSQSSETDKSTDGSNGNTDGECQNGKKRHCPEKAYEDGINGTSSGVVMKVNDNAPQPCTLTNENLIKNERELKRQKRKQSNRESARRSRLRKQSEAEELAKRVDALNAENLALKSEISRITENSETLKAENAALSENIKKASPGQKRDRNLNKAGGKRGPVNTENLLSRVNKSVPTRKDAVAAG